MNRLKKDRNTCSKQTSSIQIHLAPTYPNTHILTLTYLDPTYPNPILLTLTYPNPTYPNPLIITKCVTLTHQDPHLSEPPDHLLDVH